MYSDDDGNWYQSYYGEKPENIAGMKEQGRKQAIQWSVKKYFDGIKSVRDKRHFYNESKKLIPQKQYEESLDHQKAELENSLSGLLRKDDRLSSFFGLDKLTSA